MSKNTIVYQHTDGRIFRLKVIPVFPGIAEVVIKEVVGCFVRYRTTCTFNVAEFNTISAGAMHCLYSYLAEKTKEDEIARKWQEFENRG